MQASGLLGTACCFSHTNTHPPHAVLWMHGYHGCAAQMCLMRRSLCLHLSRMSHPS
jgi:hypothetical protein